MAKRFKTTLKVTFRQADSAGIMFFGNLFGLAHDAYEQFIVDSGFTWDEWFNTREYLIPIRHSEADYDASFLPGQDYEVSVVVKAMGNTSFTVKYIFSQGDKVHAKVEMVHVVLDGKTRRPIPIPGLIRERLAPYMAAP